MVLAPDYESVGRGFKSLRARQILNGYRQYAREDVIRLTFIITTGASRPAPSV